MSGSSNLNSFRDRRQVAVQLVSCGVLPPGLVQDCMQHGLVANKEGAFRLLSTMTTYFTYFQCLIRMK